MEDKSYDTRQRTTAMNSRPHRKLEVWKRYMDLVKDIYQDTESFPESEIYGLTSQMRRAAVSIPSNSCPVKCLTV